MSRLAIHENKIYSLGDNAIYTIPTILPSPTLWLRADAGVVKGGDNLVSEWQDQSGNGHHAEQTSHADKPLFVANVLNNLPVLRFDKPHWIEVRFPEVFTQPNTIFTVWKSVSPEGGAFSINDEKTRLALFQYQGNRIYAEAGISLIYFLDPVTVNYRIHTWHINGINSSIYENGILKNTGNSGDYGITLLRLGKVIGFNSWSLEGDIAEIIFYNSLLSDPQRKSVEQYLLTKYGL